MQDYEQYTRISRAPVILPPAGTPTDAEEEKEPIPQQDTQPEEEQQQAPGSFRPDLADHSSDRRPKGGAADFCWCKHSFVWPCCLVCC